MIADEVYEICQPILKDETLEEEDKVEKLEEVLRKDTNLNGKTLENTILDALWRHRNASKPGAVDIPSRHIVIRKAPPAARPMPRTSSPLTAAVPTTATPTATPPANTTTISAIPPGFPLRSGFSRHDSLNHSPFGSPRSSPRPSPRLGQVQPALQPPLSGSYGSTETSQGLDMNDSYTAENIDWLVGDDTASNASSTGTGQLSAAAPEWTPQPDMSPHDILRSVLGDRTTNDEIDEALEQNSYDLGATIAQLSGGHVLEQSPGTMNTNKPIDAVVVGKSMQMEQTRPVTPNPVRSPIVCKYWLASGSCLRADCRFSHDLTGHICKYWMAGNCLAGDACQFSHDPSALMNVLSVSENASLAGSPPQFYQIRDHPDHQSPSQKGSRSNSSSFTIPANGQFPTFTPMSHQRARNGQMQSGSRPHSRPTSRPTSRHQQRSESHLFTPAVDDTDAFPSLTSLNNKRSSKHHGQRARHSTNNLVEKEGYGSPSEPVRISPSPVPSHRKVEVARKVRPIGMPENAAAQQIAEPRRVPWLETGPYANQQYLKHRQDAIKHGGVRNKFLQSAAQAWNRNDTRAAKALSLRGQAENEAMRKAHREAAKHLYEDAFRTRQSVAAEGESVARQEGLTERSELYIDLHGLHPEEAIEYIDGILATHGRQAVTRPRIDHIYNDDNIIYAITGTGHHSKNGKDKVGKAVRNWLTDTGYVFREFSVPGERGGYMGGVLGIDAASRSNSDGTKRGVVDGDNMPDAGNRGETFWQSDAGSTISMGEEREWRESQEEKDVEQKQTTPRKDNGQCQDAMTAVIGGMGDKKKKKIQVLKREQPMMA